MRNKISYILLLSALILTEPAFAISRQSQNALSAFRRYEPEFSNSLRSLQELKRKQDNETDDENLSKTSEMWLKAENIMSKVEDRYDLMEDLYNSTLSRNPADQIELQEGFNRLEDTYKKVRDYYTENYTYNGAEKETSANVTEKEEPKEEYDEYPYEVSPLSAEDGYGKVIVASDQERKEKIKVIGNLKCEFRDSSEKHMNPNMGETVPNDLTSGRLKLTYELDKNRQLYIEDKYLARERNEKVKENHFTLSFMKKNNDNSALTFRDKLQHVWYPDNTNKNYHTNLLEALYAKNWRDHDLELGLGFKTKSFPHNSRADYNEYSFNGQESWMKRDSTIFAELKTEFVRYKNVDNLDYKNINLYTELNKDFSGNKANLMVSNTYDRRLYEEESLISFRTSYYDDLFKLNYNLPVNDKTTYYFDGTYSKRNYSSDEPRGYAEIDIHNGVMVQTDDRTLVTGDYTYIYNDENTRNSAHKNNIFHVGWQRNVNKDYKIKIDDTYHARNSVQNAILDFDQNQLTIDLSWTLKNNYKLSWITEHFNRKYDNISINLADYRYLESGFVYSYYKRKCYDWSIEQKWRNMEFRNWGGVPSGWTSHIQPVTHIKYNKWLRDNLKLAIRGTIEKTYYSEFHSDSQELEYNFGDPVYNKEIYASIEYMF